MEILHITSLMSQPHRAEGSGLFDSLTFLKRTRGSIGMLKSDWPAKPTAGRCHSREGA